jgi:hypothetical protein
MPCDIEWHGKAVHWKFSGVSEADEQIEKFSSLYGDERFDSTRAQIRNYNDATNRKFSLNEIKRIAAYDLAAAKTNPQMKIALVLDSKDQEKTAFMSFYDAELYDCTWQVSFFESLEDALVWVA